LCLSTPTSTTELYTLSLHDALPILPGGVAELDAPGGFRGVERRGIGRIDVDEPVGRAEVDDLSDDGVAPLRDVPPVEWDHADERSEEHTSELQSRFDLVCRLLLEKK